MNFPLSRRRHRRFGEMGKEWDLVLLVVLPAIAALVIIFTIKAVLLRSVAVENKERLEERFEQNRREAIYDYERDLSRQSK